MFIKLLKYILFELPNKVRVFKIKGIKSTGLNFRIDKMSTIASKSIRIGHNVTIGKNVHISTDELVIGNDSSIQDNTTILAKRRVDIGSNSIIQNHVEIGGLQTAHSEFKMGNHVNIFPYSFLNTTMPLILEDYVGIGGSNYIFTHGSWQDAYEGFPYSFAPVTIKEGAWLPWRVFVMPGVTIGKEATIGSDALITKNIPDRSFAVGVPAKVVKTKEQYIKVMTPINKTELMTEILKSFSEYLTHFKNISAKFKFEDDCPIVTLSNGMNIKYDINKQIANQNEIILTELDSKSNISKNVIDLKNKQCTWSTNQINSLLIKHLSNYGIKINCPDKYA